MLDATLFYMKTLAVPARRNVDDPLTQKGAALFEQIGCQRCHISTFTTKVNVASPTVQSDYSSLFRFPITRYGPGLADGRPDFEASGSDGAQRRSGASA